MVVTLGIFALLIGMMPSELYANQSDYTPPTTQDQAVVDYFSANNITLYANSWSGYLVEGSYLENASGLPEGHTVSVEWTLNGGYSHIVTYHKSPGTILWLFPSPWPNYEWMYIYHDNTKVDELLTAGQFGITRDILEWADNDDTALFRADCPHISMNFVLLPTDNETSLLDCFDAGNMTLLASYEIDFEAMKPSAWLLISQLVTFQSPDLGIPGDFGDFITYAFGIGFWVVVAIIIYTILTRIIPTISGGVEG